MEIPPFVDVFPTGKGGFPASYVSVPEGIYFVDIFNVYRLPPPPSPTSPIGAARPSSDAVGNWTREGLLRVAGERKVDAELFPRAQVHTVR